MQIRDRSRSSVKKQSAFQFATPYITEMLTCPEKSTYEVTYISMLVCYPSKNTYILFYQGQPTNWYAMETDAEQIET
jgi:hypothetical protein